MGIMQGLRKKERSNSRARSAEAAQAPRKLPETTTPLMMLLPDAAGIAAYQLNEFPSAKAAEFFIDSSLRGRMPDGAVSFWALGSEPEDTSAAEPLVLIRDGQNVVYPFSFSDVQSAFDFVKHEMS